MLSQTADYALRAVVALSQAAPQSLTTEQIAERTKVPQGYLSKVLQQLARSHLIESRRGVRGGYVLTTPPQHITLLAVINAIDPIKRSHSCSLKNALPGAPRCRLHRVIDEAVDAMEHVMASSSLADLLNEDPAATVACGQPSTR